MVDGQATIPRYDLFPTALPGHYESIIQVTSQSPHLDSATASYTVLPTTGTVHSISISFFSPLTTIQRNHVTNYGSFSGSGNGAVEYHWITEKEGVISDDSGPLTVQMVDGKADTPIHSGFPTDATGQYESYVRVTSQAPERISDRAIYVVIPNETPDEIVVDLPGLPEDALPLTLVRIPAGSFMMGAPDKENGAHISGSEYPQHKVTLYYDFYIGKYEVTQAQWEAVMGARPWQGQPAPGRVGAIEDPDAPATYVAWDDIRDSTGFVNRMNALGQGRFRLPSEAEWEYACRAFTATRYYWGDDPNLSEIRNNAWYNDNSFDNGLYYAHPVGFKAPNALGLYDMSGNAAEWCEDWSNVNYVGAPIDGTAWREGDPALRVLRGLDFYSAWDRCRPAARRPGTTSTRTARYGFRMVREVPEEVSLSAGYSVISTAGQDEIIIQLPGLPADATPLVMVRVPAGSFMMGSVGGDYDARGEFPQHRVDIGYDYYIGKYEITKAQWQSLMGTTPWVGQGSGWNTQPDSSVTFVSWDDIRSATGFLERLNALGQGIFRLPSEAEWEYACRACTATRFYWGDDYRNPQIGSYAWYIENRYEDGVFGPHRVGQKLPNAFGLYDMSGNAAEWCEDWSNNDYIGAPSDGSAWTTGESTERMFRGGRFNGDAPICRSSSRW